MCSRVYHNWRKENDVVFFLHLGISITKHIFSILFCRFWLSKLHLKLNKMSENQLNRNTQEIQIKNLKNILCDTYTQRRKTPLSHFPKKNVLNDDPPYRILGESRFGSAEKVCVQLPHTLRVASSRLHVYDCLFATRFCPWAAVMPNDRTDSPVHGFTGPSTF